VAWIKADSKAILAIHDHVITNNERMSVTQNDRTNWTLKIHQVTDSDEGYYMCQVNSEPMLQKVIIHEVQEYLFSKKHIFFRLLISE
jgi:neurotrimin